LLDELCRSRHGIRIDLDVWQQILVSSAMKLRCRAAKLNLHAALLHPRSYRWGFIDRNDDDELVQISAVTLAYPARVSCGTPARNNPGF